jgi:hypothetical protein
MTEEERRIVGGEEKVIERVDWTNGGSPSTAVVQAVARSRDCSPTELDSLEDAVDTDALNALFAPRYDGTSRGTGSVSFSYADRHVVVFSDGRVVVSRT